MKIIHLIMANENSEAGSYYNESTINFIRKIIETNLNFVKFPILEKVKEFLFEHSGEFFNEPIENIDDIKIIEENDKKLLKYINTSNDYELKECYVDELGNANFIQSNYKPSYRAYKVKYKDENGESNKLIIDIEISGEIKDIEELNPKKENKNEQNIITITGNRKLKKLKTKSFIAENKSSYFDNENSKFKLRIYIPNEQGIIKKLYKKQFDLNKGLYRFIYNIQENNGEEEKEMDYEIN